MTEAEKVYNDALNHLARIGTQGPRSAAEQSSELIDQMRYSGWPGHAIELDKKLNQVIAMLAELLKRS